MYLVFDELKRLMDDEMSLSLCDTTVQGQSSKNVANNLRVSGDGVPFCMFTFILARSHWATQPRPATAPISDYKRLQHHEELDILGFFFHQLMGEI